MDEREKIIEIIESNKLCVLDMDCNDCPYKDKLNKTYSCGSYKLADTLIEAGIGDVTEHEAETEYWGKICKVESDEHHTAIKNAAEHARHLMQERDEYKRRAEVTERALLNLAYKIVIYIGSTYTSDFSSIAVEHAKNYIELEIAAENVKNVELEQAEKEIAEDEE